MRAFLLIWLGQLVSTIGSNMTGFALGIWVLQTTGSTTDFAIIFLSGSLPGILMSPIAGAIADRWDRRRVMMLSDAGAALSTAVIAFLFFTGRIETWHIYMTSAVAAAFGAFQWPAYSAATTLLVPKKHYGRASGMVQTAYAIGQIASPALAGILLATVHVRGIVLIDLATCLFALGTLLFVRIPRPEASPESSAEKGSIFKEAAYGWRYIQARPGLLGLVLLFAATNFCMSMVLVYITPLVLGFASPEVLGSILSAGGVGMLVGSIVMSVWGGPKRRVLGIVAIMAIEGVLMLAGGIPNAIVIGVGNFLLMFTMPIVNGCSQAIWQSKVAPDVQGRVFAIRRMIAWGMNPLAYAVAGPLADRVFIPLLVEGGPLAGSVGRIVGVGPTRGLGLLFVVLGLLNVVAACVMWLYPRLRHLETELPDAIPDEPVDPMATPTAAQPTA